MELKEFIKKVLIDTTEAVSESREASSFDMRLKSAGEKRTIEFDIAVSAEENKSVEGGAGIKVLQFIEAGGQRGSETKNSTVSRIRFGIDVDELNKQEKSRQDAAMAALVRQSETDY